MQLAAGPLPVEEALNSVWPSTGFVPGLIQVAGPGVYDQLAVPIGRDLQADLGSVGDELFEDLLHLLGRLRHAAQVVRQSLIAVNMETCLRTFLLLQCTQRGGLLLSFSRSLMGREISKFFPQASQT